MGQNWFKTVYNCKHFEPIWVNYKQPPRHFWCRADHCHPACPEKKINVASIPKYSKYKVQNPSSYKDIVVPKRNSTAHSSNPLHSAKSFSLRTATLGKSYAVVKASLKPEATMPTAATDQMTKPSEPATTRHSTDRRMVTHMTTGQQTTGLRSAKT